MILPDHEIERYIREGLMVVEPFEAANVQPSSLDVRLDGPLTEMDTTAAPYIIPTVIPPNLMRARYSRIVYPGDFVLGSTREVVSLPSDIAAQFEGKSSLARIGLSVHQTAGFIDPGFSGQITLEIKNVGDLGIVLEAGMLIGQILFHKMAAPVDIPYGSLGAGSHYQGQRGPTPAHSVNVE